MKTKISIFSIVMAMLVAPAFAGWQYDGYYTTDGYYRDDGSRFVVNLRGGLAMSNAKMKNEIGWRRVSWVSSYINVKYQRLDLCPDDRRAVFLYPFSFKTHAL